MITVNKPTNPKSIISSRIPNINLKKVASFSKKACSRNIPFIKKYRAEVAIPKTEELKAFKFMYIAIMSP